MRYLVCYKLHADSMGYWSVYEAESEQAATDAAERDGLFRNGRFHTFTVPQE